MEYFFSHIGYIVIAALVIAALCVIWAFVGIKNEKERDFNAERCEFKCESCGNYNVCNKTGKKEIL